MTWRVTSLVIVFSLIYFFLIFNIYNLQLQKRSYYLSLAEARDAAGGVLKAERGNIYFTDKNGIAIPAVLNKEYPIVYAAPAEVQEAMAGGRGINTQNYAEKLAGILDKSAEEIEKQLAKKNDKYELLREKATAQGVEAIKKLDFKGVYIKNELLRFYPFGDLASHLLGFVSPANDKESLNAGDAEFGRYGVELYFNQFLAGQNGRVMGDKLIEPEKGKDFFLTIDRNIQFQAEEILKNLIQEKEAEAGTAIVEEPKTGKILAMASFPNFDPNNYSEFEVKKFLNPAIEAVYEPGSIFKVLTMAAGIDSGKITPETEYTDTGSVTFNGKTIRNWDLKAHGRQTMTGVIEQSINTGAVFAARKTGPDIFYDYLNKFGLSEKTKIQLPGEVSGNISNLKHGRDIDFATAAFGQGVAATPIALVSAVSTIANGGLLMRPYILSDEEPKVARRVLSEETSRAVTRMMISAVEKNKLAAIPNYNVAGKTGTAFVPDFKRGGYTDEVINTYIGFAPASDPRFIISIKLEKPAGSPLAGQTVVPAFRELAEFILNYYNIAPDKLETVN